MDVRNNLQGLSGTSATEPAVRSGAKATPTPVATGELAGDQALLSRAASQVSQSSANSEVRTEKVASIQAQLQAGTYNPPVTAVAKKLVDSLINQAN